MHDVLRVCYNFEVSCCYYTEGMMLFYILKLVDRYAEAPASRWARRRAQSRCCKSNALTDSAVTMSYRQKYAFGKMNFE